MYHPLIKTPTAKAIQEFYDYADYKRKQSSSWGGSIYYTASKPEIDLYVSKVKHYFDLLELREAELTVDWSSKV
jgi:hypothetical protein